MDSDEASHGHVYRHERNMRLCVYAGGGAEVNSCGAYALEVILGKSGWHSYNPYDEYRGLFACGALPKKRVMLGAVKSTDDGSIGKQE